MAEDPIVSQVIPQKISKLQMFKENVDKILSGRLFLTIVAGIILFKMGKSPMEAGVQAKLFDIIEMIVMFYFLKPGDTNGKNTSSPAG